MGHPLLDQMMAAAPAAAGGWTPASIADLTLWYDPSDASTITSSGGLVSQMNDKTGLGGRNLTAVGTARPQTGTRTINGLNVIDCYDMAIPTRLSFVTGSTYLNTNEVTTFLVVVGDGNNGSETLWSLNKTGQGDWNTTTGWSWGTRTTTIYYNSSGRGSPGFTNGSGAHVVELTRGGATWLTYKNGTAGGGSSSSPTGNFDTDCLLIGSGWDGAFGEIIVYNRLLNTTDRQTVEAYLKAKWGTP